jgi:hypothetical protein
MSHYKESWAELLSTIHNLAKKEGFSPRHYARHLIVKGKDTFGLMSDADSSGALLDLTPDCPEYIALKAWFGEWFADRQEKRYDSLIWEMRDGLKNERNRRVKLAVNSRKGTESTKARRKQYEEEVKTLIKRDLQKGIRPIPKLLARELEQLGAAKKNNKGDKRPFGQMVKDVRRLSKDARSDNSKKK